VILDKWIFNIPDIHIGHQAISLFNRDTLPIDRLSLPWVGQLNPNAVVMTFTVVFAALHLLIVAVRRSTAGDRLLALRESPAACATLGLDPAAARLAVFGFSAAMAAVGGGLYATTLGSVTPSNFDLFQSLPLLLVTVAGGVATTGGALFAAITLASIPAVAAALPALAGILGITPGTLGITLGRNPDGVVPDLRNRLLPLTRSVPAAVVVAAVETALAFGWLSEAVSGWQACIVGFLAPFVAASVVELAERPARVPDPLDELELLGVDRPVTADDLATIDRALALAEVPR
jgi:branched-chain amino acid transport system permease protein